MNKRCVLQTRQVTTHATFDPPVCTQCPPGRQAASPAWSETQETRRKTRLTLCFRGVWGLVPLVLNSRFLVHQHRSDRMAFLWNLIKDDLFLFVKQRSCYPQRPAYGALTANAAVSAGGRNKHLFLARSALHWVTMSIRVPTPPICGPRWFQNKAAGVVLV